MFDLGHNSELFSIIIEKRIIERTFLHNYRKELYFNLKAKPRTKPPEFTSWSFNYCCKIDRKIMRAINTETRPGDLCWHKTGVSEIRIGSEKGLGIRRDSIWCDIRYTGMQNEPDWYQPSADHWACWHWLQSLFNKDLSYSAACLPHHLLPVKQRHELVLVL